MSDRPYQLPPRCPDELLSADLPDWVKLVWLAVRKVQGNNDWAHATRGHYGSVCGKSSEHVSRALTVLEDTGWIDKNGRDVRCLLPAQGAGFGSPNTAQGAGNQNPKPAQGAGKTAQGAGKTCTGCSPPSDSPYKDESLLESSIESRTRVRATPGKAGGKKSARGKGKSGARTVAQKPPALAEVEAYFAELGRPDLAAQFHDHHTAGGWRVGKGPMKDWRAAARTWKRNDEKWNAQRKKQQHRPRRRHEVDPAEAFERISAAVDAAFDSRD